MLRIAEVKTKVGLGKSKIYALVAQGRFPKPYKLTPSGPVERQRDR